MATTSDKSETGKICRKRTRGQFKGVRMRKWGRWVSEIRIPQSKYRIWLGSYDTPEKAARAYDAALYCIHGSKGKFNFPNELRPEFPDGLSTSFFKSEIKAVASRFASLNSPSDLSSTSSSISTTGSPKPEADALVSGGGETGSTWEAAGTMHFANDGQPESDFFAPENFLLDEPFMMEPDLIWDILDRN
ncbi:hypothetical protein MKW94_008858 [Papaver nudicaule]|uniref:AP2/ERF domain-containing protein n=1 Tax=Papaver nudicaule TaxID=74823 RepID=A0AA41V1J6_PAPNU|nr:hypothetical protein [Papaver nudicaule]